MSDIALGSENVKIKTIKLYLKAIILSALLTAISPDPSIVPDTLQILDKYLLNK